MIVIFILIYSYTEKQELKQQNNNPSPILHAQKLEALRKEREEIEKKNSVRVTSSENKKTIRTDGIYIAMPSAIGRKAIEANLAFGLIFNKKGIVYRSMGDYDEILEDRIAYVNEFSNYNNTKTSDSTSLFKITNNIIHWKLYNPDSEANQRNNEPLDYSEYEGVFSDSDITLTSRMSYYDQNHMKFLKRESYNNVVFKFYKTN